jgi:hypothetical protein
MAECGIADLEDGGLRTTRTELAKSAGISRKDRVMTPDLPTVCAETGASGFCP